MRLLVRAGTSSDPKDKLGLAHLAASLLDQGTTTKSARGDERRRRLHRRRDGRRRRHRSDLRQHGGDEGQLRRPACGCCPTWRGSRRSRRPKSSGSASRCCRGCRSASRIPDTSPTRCSIGWSTGSIPTACRRTARRRRSPALTRDDLVAFHARYLRAEQRHPRDRRRRDRRRGVRGGEEGVRRLGRSAICRRRPSSSRPIRRAA